MMKRFRIRARSNVDAQPPELDMMAEFGAALATQLLDLEGQYILLTAPLEPDEAATIDVCRHFEALAPQVEQVFGTRSRESWLCRVLALESQSKEYEALIERMISFIEPMRHDLGDSDPLVHLALYMRCRFAGDLEGSLEWGTLLLVDRQRTRPRSHASVTLLKMELATFHAMAGNVGPATTLLMGVHEDLNRNPQQSSATGVAMQANLASLWLLAGNPLRGLVLALSLLTSPDTLSHFSKEDLLILRGVYVEGLAKYGLLELADLESTMLLLDGKEVLGPGSLGVSELRFHLACIFALHRHEDQSLARLRSSFQELRVAAVHAYGEGSPQLEYMETTYARVLREARDSKARAREG